jgi:hypothetical protein
MGVVDSHIGVELAAVLEGVEEADGGEDCLAGTVGVVADDEQRPIEHGCLPDAPQLLVAGVEVVRQLHLLESSELQQGLLRYDLLECGLALLAVGVEVLHLQQTGAGEVVDVVGDVHGDLIVQDWQYIAGKRLGLRPFIGLPFHLLQLFMQVFLVQRQQFED